MLRFLGLCLWWPLRILLEICGVLVVLVCCGVGDLLVLGGEAMYWLDREITRAFNMVYSWMDAWWRYLH